MKIFFFNILFSNPIINRVNINNKLYKNFYEIVYINNIYFKSNFIKNLVDIFIRPIKILNNYNYAKYYRRTNYILFNYFLISLNINKKFINILI